MGVADGQAVSAGVTNPAFINKNVDDTTTSLLGLANTATASGASVTNTQREFNAHASFMGVTVGSAYNVVPAWTSNVVGNSTNSLFTRLDLVTALFHGTTGHKHTGAAGDGPLIPASSVTSVPLAGYIIQGTNFTGSAANSSNVSSLMSGRTASSGSTVEGVVVSAPYNFVTIRNSSNQDEYVDASGNTVYGRLTKSGSVWTLSYYSLIVGVETAYTFSGTPGISWYFQQLYSPLGSPPVYNPSLFIPSDNVTADVIVATTALKGKVQLATAAPGVIAASGSAGTANATVANADHTHAGVHSVLPSGGSQILGDVTLAAANASGSALSVAGASSTITYTFTWPFTLLGDLVYGGTSAAVTVLAGNTTTTKKYLSQTGTGSASAAPAWAQIAFADLSGTASATQGGTGLATYVTGDILYASATNTLAALAGNTTTTRKFLRQTGSGSASAAPAWDTLVAADYPVMIGDSGSGGTRGAVGAPAAGDAAAGKFWKADGTWALPTGGGGGGSLYWVEDVASPAPVVENHNQVYAFAAGLSQVLYALVKVPNGYIAGNPIKLRSDFYSPDSSGNVLMQTVATLIRQGTDAMTSTTNQRTSTNSAVTLGAGTVNIPQSLALDLSSATGTINGVAVAAGDFILVAFQRGSDTATSDAKVPVYGSEVTFS